MEYFIKDIIMGLLVQRGLLNEKFLSLDQNNSNYSIKQSDLSVQINKIDMEINNMIFNVKDFNIQELTIKNKKQ